MKEFEVSEQGKKLIMDIIKEEISIRTGKRVKEVIVDLDIEYSVIEEKKISPEIKSILDMLNAILDTLEKIEKGEE